MQEWVVYRPSKSVSFGHWTRARPRKSWAAIKSFLERASSLELIAHSPPTLTFAPLASTDGAEAGRRIAYANDRFGPPKTIAPNRSHMEWELSESQLNAAVEFALDDDRYPEQEDGPSRLHVGYRWLWPEFAHLVKVADYRPLQNTMGITIGRSILGKSIFITPHLVIPAPWDSAELRAFLLAVEPTFPFRASDHNFKRWLAPKKAGTNGKYLKLGKDWRRNWLVQ